MGKTLSDGLMVFRKSLDWLACLTLTIIVFQPNVIAFPIIISIEEQATTFLQKYGYLRIGGCGSSLQSIGLEKFTAGNGSRTQPTAPERDSDELESDSSPTNMASIKNAVVDYQGYMGLGKTDELDDATLTMMGKPRCGVKDKVLDDDTKRRRRRKRYSWEGSRYASTHIYYKINKYPKRLADRRSVDSEFKRAFKAWSYHTPLKFVQRDYGNVHIEISFEERYHGHGNSFDGPGWTLAHASAPKGKAYIHFDDEEEWTIDEYSGMNLFQVAAHEIGHALGLLHSNLRDSLMFSNYNDTEGPAMVLTKDDIDGIRDLYGDLEKLDMCSIYNSFYDINAATTTEDRKSYLFVGRYYWEVVKREDGIARPADGYPRNITDDWVGLPVELDAALTWPEGQTFFFKGDKYWVFRNKTMDPGYPKLLSEGFEGIPMNIDAAFTWDDRTFFFQRSNFWEYDRRKTPPVSAEYPQPISNLNGMPDYIDAALQFVDKRTYLFKHYRFHRLNNEILTVDPQPPGTDRTSKGWFAC